MQNNNYFFHRFIFVTIFTSVLAMEEKQPSVDHETIKAQAKEKLIGYINSENFEDTQERENVAYTLDCLFSDNQLSLPWQKIGVDENVPGENYNFAHLKDQLVQRYCLAKMNNLYRLRKKRTE